MSLMFGKEFRTSRHADRDRICRQGGAGYRTLLETNADRHVLPSMMDDLHSRRARGC